MTAQIEGKSESGPIRMGPATDTPLGFEHGEVDDESREPARGGPSGHHRSNYYEISIEYMRNFS